ARGQAADIVGDHGAVAAALLAHGGGQEARAGDGGEGVGAGRRGARVAVQVDAVEPELRAVAFGPLEVVHQAPVVVAAHVDAARTRAIDLLEDAHDVLGAPLADLGREAGFGDD